MFFYSVFLTGFAIATIRKNTTIRFESITQAVFSSALKIQLTTFE